MDAAVDLVGWLGAAGLTISSGYHQAWPSAALNVVWIVIGLATLHAYRRRRATPDAG